MLKITHYHSSRFIEMFGQVDDTQSHYPIKRMVECCSYISDGSHYSPTEDSQGTYPMLSVKDMTDNGFSYSGCKYIGRVDYEKLVANGCKPQKNDVLVAKDGSYFKYAFVVNEDKEQAILSSIAMLRPYSEMVRPRYLAYYMLTDAVVKLVEKNYLTGTAIRRVILKGFKVLPVIVPDLEAQDDFIHILEQADKSKFTNFKSRFIEMFGDTFRNEKEWAYNSLSKITSIVLGTTPSSSNPDYWDGDIKWITPAELNDDSFYVYDSERHITEAGVRSAALKSFPAGTVIFSTRAPIGKTAIAGCEMYCNQGFKNFICSEKLNPVYLFYTLKSHKEELQKMGTGSTFLELSKKTIEGISISTPPRVLQDEFEVIYKQADKSKYLN